MFTLPAMYNLDPKKLAALSEAGESFVFTPDRASQAFVEYVERFQGARKVSWGCKTLDNRVVTPMAPGEVTTLIARPGSGKTSLMVYLARREALRCDVTKGECVIYVTWEEPVESIEMSIQSGTNYTSEEIAFGTVDIEKVKAASTSRGSLPLIIIGRSLMSQFDTSVESRPLYIETVRNAILSIFKEYELRPTLICGDYIQSVPFDQKIYRGDRTAAVTDAMLNISSLSREVVAPFLLGAQSTRAPEKYKLPIPLLSDAQWASIIEQESFRTISLLRPQTLIDPGQTSENKTVQLYGVEYEVNKNLLLLALLKQRKYSPPRNLFAVHFEPDTFKMMDIDTATKQPYVAPEYAEEFDFRIEA